MTWLIAILDGQWIWEIHGGELLLVDDENQFHGEHQWFRLEMVMEVKNP